MFPGGVLGDFGGRGVSANSVAKVDGQDVTIQEVDQVARNIMQRAHIPEQFKSYILPQAVDAVVMQKVYLREAKRLGLEATDDDLRYEMQHGGPAQALYPNGTFIGADQYRDLVATQFNLSVPQFEQELRDELTMRKLRSVIGAGVFVSNAEVHDAFVKVKTKVKFDYAVLSVADLEKSVTVEDSELRAFYEKNQQQFANTIPEQRKIKYVVVDPARLPNPAKATNDELQSYYRATCSRVPRSRVGEGSPHSDQAPAAWSGWQGGCQAGRGRQGKGAGCAEPASQGRRFRRPGEEVLRRYRDREGWRFGGRSWCRAPAPHRRLKKLPSAWPRDRSSDLIPTSYGFEIIRVDDKTVRPRALA